ncbi:MAG TPA: PQQ-binding-like beta-propeller repeat protein [Solirubrobacteraceae bacterium]
MQQSSPWPTMRRDLRNTASSPIVGRYEDGRPWAFKTGKGIFSTPVIGGNGTAYFGSADTYFYAVNGAGKQVWRFKTGNLIDSAGFVGAWNPRLRTYPVAVPSGDTHLYLIRSDARQMPRAKRIIWTYTPPNGKSPLGETQLVNWWEGNAEPGPDGTIYAGSTGDAAYALTPDGKLKWVYRSIGPFWTDPAMEPNGTTYWGSLDLQVHALNAAGKDIWRFPTGGFVTSSPALDNDGTLYVGSFDSNLYALDAATGLAKWKFTTGDHIYGSPALDEDAQGHLRAIYIGSTDGRMYAVSPTGKELWAYDTGDVIRSSPVIGLAPDGVHRIVYFGAGNGVLYALNAADGSRRWSYDTTRPDPILRDRNDLNSSPALTRTGVVIGGEDGYLKYVPYDYCVRRRDPRCSTSPGDAFPPDLNRVYAVTSGGNTQLGGGAQPVGTASVMPLRLVVRSKGETLDASMQPVPDAASLVQTSPQFPFTAQLSGDGHYMFVVPDGFLTPGRDYTIKLAGHYSANGLSVGDIRLGGTRVGNFGSSVSYHVAPPAGPLPLHNRPGRVAAFRLTRLAFPLPALLTSVNQIGFDQYNLIVGALTIKPTAGGSGSILLWAVGARPGPNGAQQVDPHTTLTFPLAGGYEHDSLLLQSHNTTLTFSFGPVPAQRLVVRAQLSRSLVARPGADIYAEVSCPDVPFYGPLLPTLRLCNNQDKLVSNGTFVTSAYGSRGTANQRPRGLGVAGVTLQRPTAVAAGSAVATLVLARGAHYPAANHLVSVVLTDAATGAAVGLNYSANVKNVADGHGDIERAELTIPAGTSLPAKVRAYVVADVFPLGQYGV